MQKVVYKSNKLSIMVDIVKKIIRSEAEKALQNKEERRIIDGIL